MTARDPYHVMPTIVGMHVTEHEAITLMRDTVAGRARDRIVKHLSICAACNRAYTMIKAAYDANTIGIEKAG